MKIKLPDIQDEQRTIKKLIAVNDSYRAAQEKVLSEFWNYYQKLKEYKINPTEEKAENLRKEFDQIFLKKTCFMSLNEELERVFTKKEKLLQVLLRPKIPLHNNTSESDIREYVKKRKISGSTRSELGQVCRDKMLIKEYFFIEIFNKIGNIVQKLFVKLKKSFYQSIK